MPYLPVGDKHKLYYEEHGNPAGRPVVVLHGGPGGGLQRSVLRFFDERKWHVVLYDQRGCGRSKPRLELHANTTPHLVADIERLREHLGIKSWTVFGGSWGSTLALAYAIKHRPSVDGLIVRGVYLATPCESDWMYKEGGGASWIRPVEWKRFAAGAGRCDRSSSRAMTACYRRRLANRKTRRAAARAWWDWEASLSAVNPRPDRTPPKRVEELAVLENHYFSHNCWLKPGELLRGAATLRDIPTTIVQGQLDLVCPPVAAAALAAAMPHAKLVLVPGAGHSAGEPALAAALKAAVERHAKI